MFCCFQNGFGVRAVWFLLIHHFNFLVEEIGGLTYHNGILACSSRNGKDSWNRILNKAKENSFTVSVGGQFSLQILRKKDMNIVVCISSEPYYIKSEVRNTRAVN